MKKHLNGSLSKLFLTGLLVFVFAFSSTAYAADAPDDSATAAKTPVSIVPVGHTVGVKMFMEGVLVVGISTIKTMKGDFSPAAEAGLMAGDVITHVGQEKVKSTELLTELLQKTGGQETTLRYKRKGKEIQTNIKAVISNQDDLYKIGAWVRDSMAGIGTLTYYDPKTKTFGALGHGITDIDTNQLMELSEGAIMHSVVKGIKKSVNGSPGELKGDFSLKEDLGTLKINSDSGIFGNLTNNSIVEGRKAIPVGYRSDVRIGKATIYSNINGDDVEEYEIEIIRLYPNKDSGTRNMMVQVTDQKLIEQTGGIVQGMSGSPIIQNGKIIGAVTHVLINDPCKGYGILIENMLEASNVVSGIAA